MYENKKRDTTLFIICDLRTVRTLSKSTLLWVRVSIYFSRTRSRTGASNRDFSLTSSLRASMRAIRLRGDEFSRFTFAGGEEKEAVFETILRASNRPRSHNANKTARLLRLQTFPRFFAISSEIIGRYSEFVSLSSIFWRCAIHSRRQDAAIPPLHFRPWIYRNSMGSCWRIPAGYSFTFAHVGCIYVTPLARLSGIKTIVYSAIYYGCSFVLVCVSESSLEQSLWNGGLSDYKRCATTESILRSLLFY